MKLEEILADYAHESWSGWMRHLFEKSTRNADGSVTIPADSVERWARQMSTRYNNLPEIEKESDRKEAHRVLGIVAGTKSRWSPMLATTRSGKNLFVCLVCGRVAPTPDKRCPGTVLYAGEETTCEEVELRDYEGR